MYPACSPDHRGKIDNHYLYRCRAEEILERRGLVGKARQDDFQDHSTQDRRDERGICALIHTPGELVTREIEMNEKTTAKEAKRLSSRRNSCRYPKRWSTSSERGPWTCSSRDID